jgi:uncharacterized protein (DUF58 family)
VRPALAAGSIGLALILVAGLFDAEPLYVPGLALPALALAAWAWVRAAARGASISRRLAATRVQEDEPLLVEIEVRAGAVPPPAGEVRDTLLSQPAHLARARRLTRVRIEARFTRRGRRRLAPPELLVSDPLGLATVAVAARGGPQEILVLPRLEPLLVARGRGGRMGDGTARRGGAEADLDGLRVHRPGTPASRIAWPVYARSGELHERRLQSGGDTRPLVVLDLAAPARPQDADAAVRAAASIAVHLAERGGCSLLLPRERRPVALDPGLRGWPAVHARLALAEEGARPAPSGLTGRSGAVIWVAARRLGEPPRGLAQATRATRVVVIPGMAEGRSPLFTVAGCSAWEIGSAAPAQARAKAAS